MENKHESVMIEEVNAALAVAPADVVVDATLGGAGHFRTFFKELGAEGTIVGIDADSDAVMRAQEAVDTDTRAATPRAYVVHDNFRNLLGILDELGIEHFDKALFDLGWNSNQLANGRGFSFQVDEPLLMTYGAGQSAAELINSASEDELADILHTYGEERFARRIAKAIVIARREERILTTRRLVEVIESAVPAFYRRSKIHPATKTFQALRIAVNDELGALREGLSAALARVSPSGKVAVITFHSIEDRLVKQLFREAHSKGPKKPLAPSHAEISRNRRARSAKLRIFSHA